MGNFIDLSGEKFGKLTVVNKVINLKDKKHSYWKCKCDCGGDKIARSDALKNGSTSHCGCVNNNGTHRKTGHRLHNIWLGMKERCYNVNGRDYARYGGRGVKICDEWLEDFMRFYNWAINNGYSDDLSIDRINVNGNYEPANCKWATSEEQANNTRKNNLITINGDTKSLSQWSRLSGVSRPTIQSRYDKGMRGSELLDPVTRKHAEFKSGVPYIKWDKKKRSWRTELKFDGKLHFIGYIKNLDEAKEKRNNLLKELTEQLMTKGVG